jgi:hypothetical protein
MVLSCALVEMRTMERWRIILKDLGANHKEYFGPFIRVQLKVEGKMPGEAQALAFPSPAWRGRVARQGWERASFPRRSRKLFRSPAA